MGDAMGDATGDAMGDATAGAMGDAKSDAGMAGAVADAVMRMRSVISRCEMTPYMVPPRMSGRGECLHGEKFLLTDRLNVD